MSREEPAGAERRLTRRLVVAIVAAVTGVRGKSILGARWIGRAAARPQSEPGLPSPAANSSAGASQTDSAITFGEVPHPDFNDRLIPDEENGAWSDLGSRDVKGIVYHRLYDTLEGADRFMRTVPPTGGAASCAADMSDPNSLSYGGCRGLLDYGIDDVTGEIWLWNDAEGDRAPWASGPVENPSGDGLAYLLDSGWTVGDVGDPALNEYVNRDQISIAIAGGLDDPISEACADAVAALSAYFADRFSIPWDDYPLVPGKTYGFVRWHNEFSSNRDCPGSVVMKGTDDFISRTKSILQRYQIGG